MKIIKTTLICFICWLNPNSLFSQPSLLSDAVDEQVFFLRDVELLVDSTNSLLFKDIQSYALSNQFKKDVDYQNRDYLENVSYWIRFPIHPGSSRKKWLIEFFDQTIDLIEVYAPNQLGEYDRHMMGDHYTFSNREYQHKNFELPLEFPKDSTVVYYFKIKSHEFADIRFTIRSVNRFIYYSLNEYFLYGTFYGMIFVIALYNLLMFLAIREIKYIYYIFYIISVALYALSIDGVGFQYIWPQQPQLNDYASGIFLYLLIFWALVFTRRFLSTHSKIPKLDRVLRVMIILRTLVFLFELFFFPDFFTFRYIEIIPLSLIFYTGIRVWLRSYRPARYFVIAYGLLLFGFVFRTLVYFNVIQLTTISHYTLHFSFVVEMLFLTIALGDRVTILKNNRDRALNRIIKQHELNMELKDKVNRELEEKVVERTLSLNKKNTELEESNMKLVKQTHEINQINSVLDLDNWKLKNNLKEVLNERLHDKTVEYDQFKTLYPDSLSCFRFLDSLKWSNGYTCRKCENPKYFKGPQKFSRRCTRCGYNESVTAFTIFQGIKFPIEKAFYMSYLVVSGKKGRTLDDIANSLEIGLNTVWTFKNKVNDRMVVLKGLGKKSVPTQWEEVILIKPKVQKKQFQNG